MYTKQFEIRWNDLDLNNHLGNSSYVELMSHTRMSFFHDNKLSLEDMHQVGLGPIVFYEHIYYFKEIHLGDAITVSLEVKGHSKDGRFVLFDHNFYDDNGVNRANCEILFSWIDLETRKLGEVPPELLTKIEAFPRSKNFKNLTKEDTRKYGKRPRNLEV
jgi:acyl-CoA thioester hydrolase